VVLVARGALQKLRHINIVLVLVARVIKGIRHYQLSLTVHMGNSVGTLICVLLGSLFAADVMCRNIERPLREMGRWMARRGPSSGVSWLRSSRAPATSPRGRPPW